MGNPGLFSLWRYKIGHNLSISYEFATYVRISNTNSVL